jgi:acyl carrier protein
MLTRNAKTGTISKSEPAVIISDCGGEKMDVYAKVKDIIVELLEVEEDSVTPDASFKDTLEADSLDLVELLMAFEDEFGSPIPDEDVKQIVTVGNAVEYIEKRLAEKS